MGGLNLNKNLDEEQHEQSPEVKEHERNPDMEDHSSDVDVSLMNLEKGKALGQSSIGNVEAAGMEAASAEASGGTGVPTRTSPAAPPSLSHAPPDNESIFVYASTQQIMAKTNFALG